MALFVAIGYRVFWGGDSILARLAHTDQDQPRPARSPCAPAVFAGQGHELLPTGGAGTDLPGLLVDPYWNGRPISQTR
jgi:hypothetical protein